jgi:hypothetical protein
MAQRAEKESPGILPSAALVDVERFRSALFEVVAGE